MIQQRVFVVQLHEVCVLIHFEYKNRQTLFHQFQEPENLPQQTHTHTHTHTIKKESSNEKRWQSQWIQAFLDRALEEIMSRSEVEPKGSLNLDIPQGTGQTLTDEVKLLTDLHQAWLTSSLT
jgi:hypothetical protein